LTGVEILRARPGVRALFAPRRWPVADSTALRVKRSRLHGQGDHSLCRPERCQWALDPVDYVDETPPASRPRRVTIDPADRTPDKIEAAVTAFIETLPYEAPDPRYLLGQIAIRLAQRVDETGALPAAVRELRVLLAQLVEVPRGPSGQVDEIRLRAAQRKLDSLLGVA
jgi:hypothetical protein